MKLSHTIKKIRRESKVLNTTISFKKYDDLFLLINPINWHDYVM